MSLERRIALVGLALVLAGCPSRSARDDLLDGGATDARNTDGALTDARNSDARPIDAGSPDAAGTPCDLLTHHINADSECVANLCDGSTTTRILFIGNSYTAANTLANLVRELAMAEGCPVEVDSSLIGGARFSTHAQNATTLAKIAVGGWDFVVLQNQSQVPGWRPADVLSGSVPHAESLATAIASASPAAQIVYFQTWGRRDGDAGNCGYYPLVCTFDGHTQALAEGYAQYAAATGGDIAPVGTAWKVVVDSTSPPFPSADLWSGDGSHPALRGSYLAAAVFFGRIFKGSPVGNPYSAGLSVVDAAFLQDVAAPFGQ